MLILAFDTATEVATSAIVADGELRGERASVPRTVLVDVDLLLHEQSISASDVDALVVGTGPGSFTSTRIGLALARGLALALGIPVAGVSTLDALAAGAEDAYPVIDARRGEVFVPGPRAAQPSNLALAPGTLCVGNGAIRYREALEGQGAVVPPDDDLVHRPRAHLHASLASEFGEPEALLPIYVRAPDARVRA